MKKRFYLLLLVGLLTMTGCSSIIKSVVEKKSDSSKTISSDSKTTSKSKSESSSSSDSSSSIASSSSKDNEVKTRTIEYPFDINGTKQIQTYKITYQGSEYKRVIVSIKQPSEFAADTDPATAQSVVEGIQSTMFGEANKLEGLNGTISLVENNDFLITVDIDMTVVNVDEVNKIENLKPLLKPIIKIKTYSPETFINSLLLIGAKEIKE
ncbi:MAG: SP0191 family lipoprotein [Streptococcus sp.]|nr:SP0191 family lipoprotein [Streptococcus sp.]